jgi:hypothetical protein
MKQKYLYLFTILIYLFISIIPAPARAITLKSGAKSEIKANIPAKTSIRLFGYTSANTVVQVLGVRVFAQTSSDKNGYWIFYDLPISAQAKELCISAIDSEKRVGFPLCIRLPDTDKPTEIGPVLLAPTISVSKGTMWEKEEAYATGFTIPNTEVKISFFDVQNYLSHAWFPSVFAAEIPIFTANSNDKGEFSFTLPTANPGNFRLFVKAIYNKMPTPKSQTLLLSIGEFINYWFQFILPKLLWLLFFFCLLIILIVWEYKTKKGRKWLRRFNEKKLKPFAVRLGLTHRRLMYNLRERKRSNRK